MLAIVTNIGYIPPLLRESTEFNGYHIYGYQAFRQLAELRHRGAFSTVSQTFAACCLQCARSSNLAFQEYPKTWYKVTYPSWSACYGSSLLVAFVKNHQGKRLVTYKKIRWYTSYNHWCTRRVSRRQVLRWCHEEPTSYGKCSYWDRSGFSTSSACAELSQRYFHGCALWAQYRASHC